MDKNILYRFFDATCSLQEEMEVRRWLEAAEANRKEFFRERKLFDAILLSAEMEEDAATASETINIFKTSRLNRFAKEIIKVAAVVLVTVSFFKLYEVAISVTEPIAMQTISVPAGQRINITLPDGTNVWLNARTTIHYPVSFTSQKRLIQLDGEAYFDVAKNEKRPFVVETNRGIVEVTGTQFNVEAYADKELFETTLMAGSVKVALASHPSEILTLAPDTKAYLKDGKLLVEHVSDYNPYRWKEGLICFKDEPFIAIMKEFEKYYGISIVVQRNTVQKYVYTGKFRQTDGIEYALRVLQKDITFKYTRDIENQIIYIR